MCNTCGCNVTEGNRHLLEGAEGARTVQVLTGLMAANDHEAAHTRAHFDAAGVLAINLMSSPGSGKTALLEATIEALAGRLRVAVIEGDLETENDAARIRAKGVPAVQITTGTACHLDAHMVHSALHQIDMAEVDILFIENVGNLVCPASFDLGHHANVTLLSTTEGDDKPAKYPVMFRAADLMLITKSDLLEVLGDFDPAQAEANLRRVANPAPVMTLSARQPETLAQWLGWLEAMLARRRSGAAMRPAVQPEGAALHGAGAGVAAGEGSLHTHAKPHEHVHEHVHTHADGTVHSHPHSHAHSHAGGPGHAHARLHDADAPHDHDHADDHDHPHAHVHAHTHTHADGTIHSHPHSHSHAHAHDHGHGAGHDHHHDHLHGPDTPHEHDHAHDPAHVHTHADGTTHAHPHDPAHAHEPGHPVPPRGPA